jgi:hypothetical protein
MIDNEKAAFGGARSVRRSTSMPPRRELPRDDSVWTPLTRRESIIFWTKHAAIFAVAVLVLWAVLS